MRQRPPGVAVYAALGDDDATRVFDAKTYKPLGELPSGPDPDPSAVIAAA